MKKYFILLISLFGLSCASGKPQSFTDNCLEVFFSKKHRIYITTEEQNLTLDTISYSSEINNSEFVEGCLILNDVFRASLSTLFIIKPDKAQLSGLMMPYYIALLDSSENIIDIQYYTVKDDLKQNEDKSSFLETTIIDTQDLIFNFKDKNTFFQNTLIIGFMLNQEKLDLLN